MRPAKLISSGWWVLAAAVVVSILVVIGFLRLTFSPSNPPDLGTISLENCRIDREDLIQAMARDGLKALTRPATMTPAEVDEHNENERGKLLVSTDRVIGVELGGEARAYPLRLLRWHEVINDIVGGQVIAVTYSPLSGSIAVWDRTVDGRTIELAVSGMLTNSNTLLYDRRSDGGASSLWHQLTGEAVSGPSIGLSLEALPASLRTWADWTDEHPDTTVMAPDPDSNRLYKRDPYHSYRGSDVLRFPVDPLPPEGGLAKKDLVAVVTVGGSDHVFALADLELAVGSSSGNWAALLDERIFMTSFDAAAGTFAITPHEEGVERPPVRFAYWFEWYALDPGVVPLP